VAASARPANDAGMIVRQAGSWVMVGAAALTVAAAAALPGCSSAGKAEPEKPEPIEISEADQRVNADTDPLNGGNAAAKEADAAATGAADSRVEPGEPVGEARPVERVTLTGGLVIEDLRVGQGPMLRTSEGVSITVHYVGRLAPNAGEGVGPTEGPIFDSTYDRGEPVTLELDRLIRGWRQGLPGMRVGGLRRLTIPPDLAYGPEGHLNVPGGATVVYEVLLLGFSPQGS
jgi:FKBP-type peptidyl-prolyl cis-trans isomerase